MIMILINILHFCISVPRRFVGDLDVYLDAILDAIVKVKTFERYLFYYLVSILNINHVVFD